MAANLLAITPDQMLFRGLKVIGVTSEEQLRRFRTSNCTNFKSHRLRSELRPKGLILLHFGINSTPNVVSLSRKYNKLRAMAYK